VSSPLEQWVAEAERTTRPKNVVWCDGSDAQQKEFFDTQLAEGHTVALNHETYPGCYLHRSNPNDVARTENVTFICTNTKHQAGPTNNWMAPAEAKSKIGALFEGCMRERTMYVIPYQLGPEGSPQSRAGVEVTDSAYVAASMKIMARVGNASLKKAASSGEFVPGLHSTGELDPNRRFIAHFPEEKLIWSYGSGYGGNALLGKKCFALRIASWMAREQGWMAEHMMIVGVEAPSGKVTYMAAAFPSACGKTNMAMMVSALEKQGYRVWTLGDDIAWLKIGADGYLRAINPENGFFGVAPGTGNHTNPNVVKAIHSNTIFTNVAMTPNHEPWWEGSDVPPPDGLIDWQGRKWDPANGPAAHPNARYTVPANQTPSISSHWQDAEGVPISAFLFGGRRARLAPLVYEAFDWQHGVYVGASMASETTAAAVGKVGVTRRDPMAMLPFCGYNMAEYFGHWLDMGKRIPNPPKIFHVNWFRRGPDGKFLWPGFGENIRVLKWIIERVENKAEARETPIGYVPTPESLTLDGLNISPDKMEELLRVEPQDWLAELEEVEKFFEKFGNDLPKEVRDEASRLGTRLNQQVAASR
jgi:phosphoenolpyruvate carboxykinase (GTP)